MFRADLHIFEFQMFFFRSLLPSIFRAKSDGKKFKNSARFCSLLCTFSSDSEGIFYPSDKFISILVLKLKYSAEKKGFLGSFA